MPNADGEGRVPDPGSRPARTLALVVLLVFFAITFYLQQQGHSAAAQTPADAAAIEPPGADPQVWMAKFAVKFSHVQGGAASSGKSAGADLMPSLDGGARSALEKIRVAIVAGDLVGPDDAIKRLKEIAAKHGLEESLVTGAALAVPEPPPQRESPAAEATEGMLADQESINPLLVEDLRTLGAIYRGEEGTLDQAQKEGLIQRHGWFGRLATTQNLPETDPLRQAVVGGGMPLFLLSLLVIVGFLGVFMAGVGLFIFFAIRIFSGTVKWRLTPPAVGGSVYLETVAVFVVSFVLFKVLLSALPATIGAAPGPAKALIISAQWLLVLPILWPLARGVRFRSLRKTIGWHSGEGVLKEMGAGILAYLAGIPILIGAAITAVVILFVWEAIKQAMGGAPSPPPENPVVEVIGGKDRWTMIAFVVLATTWAPIVEEAVFRGCLFRHARSRLGIVLAALASAVVFGGMHGYAGPLLLPVTSLGFVFALMREWRGSLIGPMTAHFLHNATVTLVLVTFVTLLGD